MQRTLMFSLLILLLTGCPSSPDKFHKTSKPDFEVIESSPKREVQEPDAPENVQTSPSASQANLQGGSGTDVGRGKTVPGTSPPGAGGLDVGRGNTPSGSPKSTAPKNNAPKNSPMTGRAR